MAKDIFPYGIPKHQNIAFILLQDWDFPFQNNPFHNNPQNLDTSYKTDLDYGDYFRRKKSHLIAEFHKTALDMYDHFRNGKGEELYQERSYISYKLSFRSYFFV